MNIFRIIDNKKHSHRIENFFTDNYDHPMVEDGVLLKDMIYLKRDIPV